jgi:hypothetical protein
MAQKTGKADALRKAGAFASFCYRTKVSHLGYGPAGYVFDF